MIDMEMKERFIMLNKQVNTKNYIERVSMMERAKALIVKVDVKKAVNTDLTQTDSFWSNLALLS